LNADADPRTLVGVDRSGADRRGGRRRGVRLVGGAVVLALAMSVLPAHAGAGGRAHGGPTFHSPKFSQKFQSHGGFAGKGDPFRSWRHQLPPDRGQRFHAPFVPFSPFVGFGGFGGTTVVATTAIAGGHESGYVAGPVAPPVASLIEYATGWYQLRGDGVTAPYTWVWIPKPPPPPIDSFAPPPPPVAAAPAPPQPEPQRETAPAGPRLADAYRWTDDQGVTTWTNRREKVPPRYRDRALPPDDVRPQ
jgi:hypothetical protein